MIPSARVSCVFLALAAVAATSSAQSLTLPVGAAGADLASSTGVPFGTRNPGNVQLVIDHSQWAGVTTPIEIQQLRFRADGGAAATWSAESVAQLDITMSHAARPLSETRAVMAQNHGEDSTLVYSGVAAVGAGSVPGGGAGVGPWYVTVALTTPFIYYPAWGRELAVELGSSGVSGASARMDAPGFGAAGMKRVSSGQVQDAGAVVEFGFVTVRAPVAAFDVSVARGPGPLAVSFTDRSWSNAPSGIVGWSWDFDNDGIVDSTAQNPTFTYSGCGNFSPSLTVIETGGASDVRVRTNLIELDQVDASFSVSQRIAGTALHTVTFTDTSAGGPTSWAWDFDGDGVVDSSAQNPVFTFGVGYHDVTLTVTNSCGSDSTTVAGAVAVNGSLTTLYSGNNGINPPGGVFFDVDVTNPAGLHVSALDVHTIDPVGTLFDVEVFVSSGTYVGNSAAPEAWSLVSRAVGVSSDGLGMASFADISDFYLPPGNYGMAVYFVGASHRYTDPGSQATASYGNSDLTLTLGESRSDRFAGIRYATRVWNGTIYYEASPGGVYSTFGQGCPNSQGAVATLTAAPGSLPRIGQNLSVQVGNLQPSQAVSILILGYNNTGPVSGFPLPLGLGPFGLGGACFLRVQNIDTFLLFTGGGGTATWTVPVPVNPAFIGTAIFNQALVLDPLAGNRIGGVMSDAAAGVIGM